MFKKGDTTGAVVRNKSRFTHCLYDVYKPPGLFSWKEVPSIHLGHQYLDGMDVIIGFLDTDRPIILSPGHKSSNAPEGQFREVIFMRHNRNQTGWMHDTLKRNIPFGDGKELFVFPEGEEPGLTNIVVDPATGQQKVMMYGNKKVYELPRFTPVKDVPNIHTALSSWVTQSYYIPENWDIIGIVDGVRHRVRKYESAGDWWMEFATDDYNTDTVTSAVVGYDKEDAQAYGQDKSTAWWDTYAPWNVRLLMADFDVSHFMWSRYAIKLFSSTGDGVWFDDNGGDSDPSTWTYQWNDFQVHWNPEAPFTVPAGSWAASLGSPHWNPYTPTSFVLDPDWDKEARYDEPSFRVYQLWPDEDISVQRVRLFDWEDIGNKAEVHRIQKNLAVEEIYTFGRLAGYDRALYIPGRTEKDALFMFYSDQAEPGTQPEFLPYCGFFYGHDPKNLIKLQSEVDSIFPNIRFFGDDTLILFGLYKVSWANPPIPETWNDFNYTNFVAAGFDQDDWWHLSNNNYKFHHAQWSISSDKLWSYQCYDRKFDKVIDQAVELPFESNDFRTYNYIWDGVRSQWVSEGPGYFVITDENVFYCIYEDREHSKIGVLGIDIDTNSVFYHYQQAVEKTDYGVDAWPIKQHLFFYGNSFAFNVGNEVWKVIV